MLPQILNSATSPEGGAKILDSMGVDKSFMDDAFNRYSKYITKIPGMNAANARQLLDKVKGAMRGPSNTNSATEISAPSKPLFDRAKYPKI